jgi:hypothetical protein
MKFEIEKGRAQSIPGIRDLVENDLFLLLEQCGKEYLLSL